MVGEVVDHGHAAGFAANFHSAPNALERVEAGLNLHVVESGVARQQQRGEGVADIEFADHRDAKRRVAESKFGAAFVVGQAAGQVVAVAAQAEAAHGAVVDAEQRLEVGVVAVGQEQAVARDDVDEALKGSLDFGEAAKNVGVIELEVVDDDGLGEVVDELAALVEKRGVVFVALNHEPVAVGETRALAKVVRDASDEEARVEAVMLEQPCEQRRGGRLAMRAGDDERAFAAQELVLEQLRQRAVVELLPERELGLGVTARDGVADDDQVRFVREVGLAERLGRDAALLEEGGHRWVDALIGAADRDAALLQRRGDGGHCGAANADEMDGACVFDGGPQVTSRGKAHCLPQPSGEAKFQSLMLAWSNASCD